MKFKNKRNTQHLQAARMTKRSKRSSEFDLSDATWSIDTDHAPEVVFDRLTGPYGSRLDEET